MVAAMDLLCFLPFFRTTRYHSRRSLKCMSASTPATPVYGIRELRRMPHDTSAFTQGLVFSEEGFLYESTGIYGKSKVRKLDPGTGSVLQQASLPFRSFGEGLTISGDHILQLTWQSGIGFIWDKSTMTQVDQWSFEGDGWGLTRDDNDTFLFLTDGTDIIRVLDSKNLKPVGFIPVSDGERRIKLLNDIQFIKGELWVNVWMSDLVAVIDPSTGKVKRWVDLRGLLQPKDIPYGSKPDVLNGIAYLGEGDKIVVTGKLWPVMFEIQPNSEPNLQSLEDTNPTFLDGNWLQRMLNMMNIGYP